MNTLNSELSTPRNPAAWKVTKIIKIIVTGELSKSEEYDIFIKIWSIYTWHPAENCHEMACFRNSPSVAASTIAKNPR